MCSGSASSSASSAGSASASASTSGSVVYDPHTFFLLTCQIGNYPGPVGHECTYFDWSWFGCWMVVLIALTIVVERGMHKVEHLSSKLLHKTLVSKMLHELALLGIVSFIIVLAQNIPTIKSQLRKYATAACGIRSG